MRSEAHVERDVRLVQEAVTLVELNVALVQSAVVLRRHASHHFSSTMALVPLNEVHGESNMVLV